MHLYSGCLLFGFFLKDIGVLKKGLKADVILIDLKRLSFPYLEARKGIFDMVLGKGNSSAVDTVLIGGEVFKRNKKLVKFDKKRVIRELKKSLKGEKGKGLVALEDLMKKVEPYIKKFYHGAEILDLKPFYGWNSRI